MIVTLAGGAIVYRPTDDELSGLSIELAAFDGEVGNGTLPVEDESAVIDVATGRQARFDEGSTLLSDGFMLDQDRDRGPIPADVARQYNFGLLDANALLDGFRIFRHRGEETDVARVLAFAAADWPAWDTSMVLNVNTVTMPPKTYDSDGGWTSELIPDVVEFTGKTLWVHDLADGSGRCLHYHNLTSGHACGLSVSDVIADALGSDTVYFPWNPIRHRTSVDLRNSVKGRDQLGHTSIQSDATSIATHDADGLQHEVILQNEAASASDNIVKTAAFLASQKDDLDTWTFVIGPLDETALALIRVGDIITVTSTVMGLTASDERIAHMTLTPALGEAGTQVPDLWMAALEVGAPIRRRARVANKATIDRVEHTPVVDDNGTYGGEVCAPVPQDFTTSPQLGENLVVTFPGDVTMVAQSGDSLPSGVAAELATLLMPAGSGILSGSVFLPLFDSSFSVAALRVEVDTGVGIGISQGNDVPHPSTPTDFVEAQALGSSDVVTYLAVLSGSFDYKILFTGAETFIKFWPSGDGEPSDWTGGGDTGTPAEVRFSAVIASTGTFDQDFTFRFTYPTWCYDTGLVTAFHWTQYGPVPVQETPDGSTDTFTIPTYPPGGYVPGTLHVWVDGVLQNFTQVDAADGTFTLSWMPATGDVVTAAWVVP